MVSLVPRFVQADLVVAASSQAGQAKAIFRIQPCSGCGTAFPENPVPEMRRAIGWQDFLPNTNALNANTLLLHELTGMLWYAVLAA